MEEETKNGEAVPDTEGAAADRGNSETKSGEAFGQGSPEREADEPTADKDGCGDCADGNLEKGGECVEGSSGNGGGRAEDETDSLFGFEPKKPLRSESEKPPMPVLPKKNKPFIAAVCVLVALILAGGSFFLGWALRFRSLDPELRDLIYSIEQADRYYTQDFKKDELYGNLFGVFNDSLDPYSAYYTAEEFAEIMKENEGELEGIGVYLYLDTVGEKELPVFYRVFENSPACLAGIKTGMYVFGCGETPSDVADCTFGELSALIDGHRSFALRCGFAADGSDSAIYSVEKKQFTAAYCLYRDSETSFAFRGEDASEMRETAEPLEGLDGSTAYIDLALFQGKQTAKQFEQCLSKMKERGRTNLVLDLRFNGGGYMDILAEISSFFVKNAEQSAPTVVTAKFKDGSSTVYRATKNAYYDYFKADSRITVLANDGTASASECLIGAMVDYGAISFGDIYLEDYGSGARTYGKGIMQTMFTAPSGGAVKLTCANIYWPLSGKSIHNVGVTERDGAVGVSISSRFALGETLSYALGAVCPTA